MLGPGLSFRSSHAPHSSQVYLITRCGSWHLAKRRGSFAKALKYQWLLQIVPRGRKWTSAFRTCGGGYLKSNHIVLTGLTRFSPTAQVHLGLLVAHVRHLAVPCKLSESTPCWLSMLPCQKSPRLKSNHTMLTQIMRFSPTAQVHLAYALFAT